MAWGAERYSHKPRRSRRWGQGTEKWHTSLCLASFGLQHRVGLRAGATAKIPGRSRGLAAVRMRAKRATLMQVWKYHCLSHCQRRGLLKAILNPQTPKTHYWRLCCLPERWDPAPPKWTQVPPARKPSRALVQAHPLGANSTTKKNKHLGKFFLSFKSQFLFLLHTSTFMLAFCRVMDFSFFFFF